MRSTEKSAGTKRPSVEFTWNSTGYRYASHVIINFLRRENVEFLQKQMEETPSSKMRGKTGS